LDLRQKVDKLPSGPFVLRGFESALRDLFLMAEADAPQGSHVLAGFLSGQIKQVSPWVN